MSIECLEVPESELDTENLTINKRDVVIDWLSKTFERSEEDTKLTNK